MVNGVQHHRTWFTEGIRTCRSGNLDENKCNQIDEVDSAYDGTNNQARKLNSLNEMASENLRPSYFLDDNGWLHMKLLVLEDRTKDSILTLGSDDRGYDYKIKGFPHIVGDPDEGVPGEPGVPNKFGAI